MGEDYLDEALSDDEAQARQVLTCQMVPTSDCADRCAGGRRPSAKPR
ncbi:hypothetical protein LNO81_15400 [Klebsiella variicola subsp. variicola]|nr:hypothetical protein [Klebsiella variicola subsp. variicola]